MTYNEEFESQEFEKRHAKDTAKNSIDYLIEEVKLSIVYNILNDYKSYQDMFLHTNVIRLNDVVKIITETMIKDIVIDETISKVRQAAYIS